MATFLNRRDWTKESQKRERESKESQKVLLLIWMSKEVVRQTPSLFIWQLLLALTPDYH